VRYIATVAFILLLSLPLSANPTHVDSESHIETVNQLHGSNVCDGTLCPQDYSKQYCYTCTPEDDHVCTDCIWAVELEIGFYICDADECVLVQFFDYAFIGTKTTGYPS